MKLPAFLGLAIAAACTRAAEPIPVHASRADLRHEPAVVAALPTVPEVKHAEPVARFAALFPLRSVDEMLMAFGEPCTSIDQGLGVELHTCLLDEGFTRCWLTLLSHEGAVFDTEAKCVASSRSSIAIAPVIRSLYADSLVPKGFAVDGHTASLSTRDEGMQQRALAAIATTLGPRSNAAVPAELTQPFALLDSPKRSLKIGRACGGAGSPPEGNLAMQELVAAGREDLLRDVMRGMNAGGRIYGYIGLRLLARNTPADDATFDRLTALDIDVDTCGGCKTTKQKSDTIDIAMFRRR